MSTKFIPKKINKTFKFLINASLKQKIIIAIIITALVLTGSQYLNNSQNEEITYETEIIQKGNLITSVSGSGTITSGNYTNITTKTSGTVSKVYVINGDNVVKGQKIAEVNLDDYAQERRTEAWASYLEAKENYLEALNSKSVADISMWQARQNILNAQEAYDDMNDNDTNPATNEIYTDNERMIITKTLDQSRLAFTVSEAKYNNSDADINNASANVASALRDYQENSATIVAPSTGIITDLALAEGIIVSASSTTSSTSGATIVSAQTVGKINDPTGQLIATISLTEIDIVNVKANQKVTLTLDAYDDKFFTGKVLAVNTSGNTNSGVTSYPVTILLDPTTVDIYPNMAVNADIIIDIKTDVLKVPTSAINIINNTTTIQILTNGQPQTIQIEAGESNDSYTVILSGINEGDQVITSTLSTTETSSTSSATSPFSGMSGTRTGSGAGGGIPPGGF